MVAWRRHSPFFILIFLNCLVWGLEDNRFLVNYLFYKPFIRQDASSHGIRYSAQLYGMFANSSWCGAGDQNTGLFDIFGCYDSNELDQALQAAGRTTSSLFRSDFQTFLGPIRWNIAGRFDAFGAAFNFYWAFHDNVALGIDGGVIHVNSRMNMIRNRELLRGVLLGPGDEKEIFLTNELIKTYLKTEPGMWTTTALTDFELYVRFFHTGDYRHRLKRYDIGAQLGVYLPAAPERNIFNPASIPIGGDRHWGMYGELNAYCILKEDVEAGAQFRVGKRFSRTSLQRMPVLNEPTNFGAIIAPANVDPGITIGFVPWVTLEGIRDKLGFRFSYAIIFHDNDRWSVPSDLVPQPNIDLLCQRSRWMREYVMLGLFYDFAPDSECHDYYPTLSLTWDMPVNGLVTQNVFKTQGVSLILEADF
jgi:hypothetical protein